MANLKVDLEKFTGKNDFNMWKVKMEALLITQGLGDALEPVTKKEGMETLSSLTPQQVADIDKRARSTIILSLGDYVIREVANEKTVADLWAKLETIFMTKSLANRLHIKKRMFTLKIVGGSSFDDHIKEFNRVCDTLETIDEILNDESKALLLVSSLPPSYSNFVDALMYKRQTLSLDEVKAALNTRGLQEKSDCPELKNKKMEKIRYAATAEEEERYESASVCATTEDIVMMGNNSVCKVIGMGKIHLKLHDESIKEVRRHILELKKNLISLGMMDQMGCSIKLESRELKILNGSTLIMKGTRNNEVYVLDGESVTGVSNAIESIEIDKTKLWHLRLGHMSIKGLKELEKQGVLENDKIGELIFCEECILGKFTRNSFKKSIHKTTEILQYIHSDLWGPSQVPSLGGNRYFMTMIDDYSRRVLLPSAVIDFKTPFEMWFGKPGNYNDLKAFRYDVYAHVKQGKLSPRALRGKFIGYPDGVKDYKLCCTNLSLPKCIISRDVIINEEIVLNKRSLNNNVKPQGKTLESIQFEVEYSDQKPSQEAVDSDGGEDDSSRNIEAQS
ncbi:hypothetical protein KPL71_025773 [Citrus sinensis]|uniref:Uncharacterized protein n=1 Tax=Citrus sinensis TaxID=2711 RepID=A0ACB8HW93_CITSI|nr:hypothetical protein KPL71_025773 [Citrus sinensis]